MNSTRFDLLFDADEYCRSGHCPWTFFAYPTSLAVKHGLPPDDDACRLLAVLQDRAIDVATWANDVTEDITYFACRNEEIQRLHGVLQELEARRVIERLSPEPIGASICVPRAKQAELMTLDHEFAARTGYEASGERASDRPAHSIGPERDILPLLQLGPRPHLIDASSRARENTYKSDRASR